MSDVVLLHAGIADSRMWAPQLKSLARDHRVIAPDLPGFGTAAYESDVVDFRAAVRQAMDRAGIERAVLVGNSFGGLIALEFALESPERVSALVLVGTAIDDHDWSNELDEVGNAEMAALERGDREGAVETQLAWVTGPRRNRDAVDRNVLALVAEMQRNVYELQEGHDDVRSRRLDPPASKRLAEVSVPTLVMTGDEDFDDILRIADRLAAEIPNAERVRIAHTAHLPSLERPDEFDRIVLRFFAEHRV
ncbi:MAG: alpha/beta fold hydrolase [Gaiellaceae bacterium]